MRSVVVKASEQIRDDGKVKLFKSYRKEYKDGEQKRDFIYVKDAVNVMMECYRKKNVRGIFNPGYGRGAYLERSGGSALHGPRQETYY